MRRNLVRFAALLFASAVVFLAHAGLDSALIQPGALTQTSLPAAAAAAPDESTSAPNAEPAAATPTADQRTALTDYGRLPLRFEANRGQAPEPVAFVSRGLGYNLFLTPTGATLALHRPRAAGSGDHASTAAVRMALLGAKPHAQASGQGPLPGRSHYLTGREPADWQVDIPAFAAVRYPQVYPGIDLVFHGAQHQLEYDFRLAPESAVDTIRLAFAGVERLAIDESTGDLVLHTPAGEVRQRKPVVYQETDGSRQAIAGSYVLFDHHQVGFQVAAYDPALELIIDPVLDYSTFLGGEGADSGFGIAVDADGSAYVTGLTQSLSFPVAPGALQASAAGGDDAFVAKLSPDGSALVYATYLGGKGDDAGLAIDLDEQGHAYLTGWTKSRDFPLANPLQSALGRGMDAFVAKLTPDGSGLVYATYLGGKGDEHGLAIAVDADGHAHVAGDTAAKDFPVVGALQATRGGGSDAFVAKLSPDGGALVFATYLGGGQFDQALGIDLDAQGGIHVTGHTASTDFPTANALQPFHGGDVDAFVAKLAADGSSLAYATYLGGVGADLGTSIGVDGLGQAHVAGTTASADFPLANAMQPTLGGGSDAFAARLAADGSALDYSTYLGGAADDGALGIALDDLGRVYLTGVTASADFPAVDPLQLVPGGLTDAFLTRLAPADGTLIHSTYLGGTGYDVATGLATDASGRVYLTGYTLSAADFPTELPLQPLYGGGLGDAFVARILDNSPPIALAGADQTVPAGSTVQLDGSASTDLDGDPITYQWTLVSQPTGSLATLTDPTSATPSFFADIPGTFTAELVVSDGEFDSAPDQVQITATPVAVNLPPYLAPIGDQTVDLGSTLALDLEATDPNLDGLSYSASPLPLPEGASLSGTSGVFSFRPTADQVGSFALTFTVSDGSLSASETVTITVVGGAGGATALAGRLLDANAAYAGQEIPIKNATVGILDASTGGSIASGTSAADGYFTVANIPAGIEEYVLDVVPSTLSADLAPDGSAYAQFREEIPLIEGVTNVWERPVYLPRIDAASLTTVDPAVTTMVDNPNLGITLEIPPTTAKDAQGNDFTGDMSISEVPRDLAPMALPAELQPSMLITIQPIGVTFAQPVPITFPNTDGLSAGSEVDIYSIDPDTGQFVVVGIGRVTDNKQSIETISGGVRDASWHFWLPPLPIPNPFFPGDPGTGDPNNDPVNPSSGDPNNNENGAPEKCKDPCTGSRTAARSGNLNVAHALPAYSSLEQSRGLRLVYNSTSADPRPIIAANTQIPVRSAVPDSLSARLSVAGVDQGEEVFTSTAGLSESVDEIIRQTLQFDAEGFQTGSYPYRLSLTNHFGNAAVSAVVADTVLVSNEANSAYGAGWTLDGVQRLHPQVDRSVVITEGDGGIKLYRPEPTAENGLNMQMFNTPDPVGAVANGFAGLAPGTFTVATAQESSTVTETRLPVVNFPRSGFDTAAFYNVGPNGFIDAGSTASAPQGDDMSIQPPGGNDTFGASISGFLLLPAGGDVTFTVGVDDAFDLIVNGQSVVKFLGITPFRNFTGTAVGLPAGFVPITLNYSENGVNANLVLSASGGGLPGGVIPQTFLFKTAGGASGLPESFIAPSGDFSTLATNPDGSFTRTLKDGTRIEFDANGLQTAMVDRNGNTTSYAYDTQDRLISITDPVGKVTTLNYVGDHLASITDPANRTTSFEHDADGNLIRITDPDDAMREFGYDAEHRLTSQTSKRDFATTYEYNFAGRHVKSNWPDGSTREVSPGQVVGLIDPASGLGTQANPAPFVRPEDVLASFTDGNGNVTTYQTDRFGAATRTTDANGLLTLSPRNIHGNAVQITRPDGSLVTRTYDDQGNLLSETEGFNGATTTHTYDAFGLRTSTTDPLGNTTTINRDAQGNPVEVINALGHTTTLEYDARGLVTKQTDPNGLVTTINYDLNGLVTTMTETPPAGGGAVRTTTFSYDTAGQRVQTVRADGVVIDRTYDALGRILETQNNLGERTVHSFDAAGNRVQTDAFDPDGMLVSTVASTYDTRERLLTESRPHDATQDSVIQFGYDGNGNPISETDPNGRIATNVYDPADRLIRTIDPLGGITEYGYDANDNLSQLAAPNGVLTQHTNDPLGQQLTEESPDRGILTRTYDLANNLKTVTDARGITATYSYDGLNRVTAISYPDPSEDVAFAYDTCAFGLGRPCERTDPSGNASFEYDTFGNVTRMVTTTLGVTYVTAFAYDEGHSLVTMTLPSGREITYTRDGLSRTQAISTDVNGLPTTVVEGVTYRADGRVTSRLYGNAVAESREYDLQGRLIRYSLPLVDDVVYNHDPAGNVLSRDTFAQAHSYAYDGLDRLINEVNAGQATSYAYDANGNRLTQSEATQTVLYDYGLNSNRLEAIGGVPVGHDAAGNRTADAQGRNLEYNDAGRLQNVSDGAALLATYVYNAAGQRVAKITSTGTTIYHYGLAGTLIGETRDDGAPLRDYLWQGQTPIAQIDIGAVETLRYLHTDHLATPRLATNVAGVLAWRWEGKGFGESLAEEDPDNDGLSTIINLRFPGQYFDEESKLHYNYFRDYDPQTGRYLQSDPIGIEGGNNTYLYAGGNSLFWSDPFGLAEQCPDQKCEALERKICNIRRDLDKRYRELAENPLGLPERAVPPERDSETRRGHRRLINRLERRLREVENEWDARGCPGQPNCGDNGPSGGFSPAPIILPPIPKPGPKLPGGGGGKNLLPRPLEPILM